MKQRFKKYQQQNAADPLINKEDVEKSPDNKIDEDFPGFPHAPAEKEMIKPESEKDKINANLNSKDGEKRNAKNEIDEQHSNGSANAFEESEFLRDDE